MQTNVRFIRNFAISAIICIPALASASPVTIKFVIGQAQVYDYVSSQYLAPMTFSEPGSVTFDIDAVPTITDYGFTTISEYFGSTVWASPVTRLIPGNSGSAPFSYTFPNVSDYPSTFIEEGASQGNSYADNNGLISNYHIELRATRRSQPRNGDGTSDYAFTRQSLFDYYTSFVSSAAPVSFSESYSNYSFVNGLPVYTQGTSWNAYSAQIISVTDGTNTVPEPGSIPLLAIGFFAIGLFCKFGKLHLYSFKRDIPQGIIESIAK